MTKISLRQGLIFSAGGSFCEGKGPSDLATMLRAIDTAPRPPFQFVFPSTKLALYSASIISPCVDNPSKKRAKALLDGFRKLPAATCAEPPISSEALS